MKKNTRDSACLLRTLLPRNRSGALEISFGWLFAIIAGAVILFLAIYFSTKLMGTEQGTVSAETGKQIDVLLNPLETSYESSQTTSFTIPAETRIHNLCDSTGNFGVQSIQLDQQSFGKWVKTDTSVGFDNKYIFSSQEIEGKKFYIFSKPFSFPFKVADLIYMTSASETYCFVNSPREVNDEITRLNQSNLITGKCPSEGIKICFSGSGCDVNVDYSSGVVEKDGEEMHFSGTGDDSKALMYAAIFSDKEVYECELSRLMLRTKEISSLYIEKELITSKNGCDDNLGTSLSTLNDMISVYSDSKDLRVIKLQADDIDQKNQARMCLLW